MSKPIHGDWGCPECVFLGTLQGHDLYFCNQSAFGLNTVIARFGPMADYESGMAFSYGQSFLLTQARLRAEHRGLM